MNTLVLGYFGYHTNQLDGQTVKTRDLYQLLKDKLCENEVDYFDTQNFQYKKSSVFVLLKKLIGCKYLFYLPAHNNLKYIFPIVFIISKICGFKILYFVIGGWLVEYLETKPMHRWMLKQIYGIFPETQLMCDTLYRKYKLSNTELFPNFRFVSFVPTEYHENGKLRIVFVARINKMKGLDTIFLLADYIRDKYKGGNILVDFYGPIYKPDKEYFYNKLKEYDFISYKGELQPASINGIVSTYDVMLLPTHYYTEGLPGSVLDAYMSGIPIIVSKWKHAEEFVEDKKTGFIIPFENGIEELKSIINSLYENPMMLSEMKKNAYKASSKYTSDSAWNIVKKYISIEQ